MRVFLIATAVITGLANALLYNTLGDSPWGGPFVWTLEPGPLFVAHLLSAILAGLAVSGVLLLLAGRKPRGGFFARYGLMVVAICAGGALLGVCLYNPIIVFDGREPVPQSLPEILFTLVFPAVLGGILGAVEGVTLAFPLAGLLGLFGNRTASQARPQL